MINRITIALVLALACFTSVHAADAVKALPTANLSGIDKENADEIRRYVERFNTRKATLSGSELAEAYVDVGAVHARVGKFDVAEVAFANAAAIAPQDGRWPYLQGLVALARGQEPAALTFFERSFKLNSGYVPGRMAFANALIRVNQLDRARAILDEFVAKEQTYPMPYAVLGDIAVRQ
ncbi:MAG: tetratricopeptide repeat protein, partial [Dokdonella sp.]